MVDWPPPSWQPIWLACKACRHEWDDWTSAYVPVATLVAHWHTYRCPACNNRGKRNVLLRTTPLKASVGFTDEGV